MIIGKCYKIKLPDFEDPVTGELLPVKDLFIKLLEPASRDNSRKDATDSEIKVWNEQFHRVSNLKTGETHLLWKDNATDYEEIEVTAI